MTLDEPDNWRHAAMLECPEHPAWGRFHDHLAGVLAAPADPVVVEMTRRQNERDSAVARRERELRDETESSAAIESLWFHPTAGIFGQMARERPWVTHYTDHGPG